MLHTYPRDSRCRFTLLMLPQQPSFTYLSYTWDSRLPKRPPKHHRETPKRKNAADQPYRPLLTRLCARSSTRSSSWSPGTRRPLPTRPWTAYPRCPGGQLGRARKRPSRRQHSSPTRRARRTRIASRAARRAASGARARPTGIPGVAAATEVNAGWWMPSTPAAGLGAPTRARPRVLVVRESARRGRDRNARSADPSGRERDAARRCAERAARARATGCGGEPEPRNDGGTSRMWRSGAVQGRRDARAAVSARRPCVGRPLCCR